MEEDLTVRRSSETVQDLTCRALHQLGAILKIKRNCFYQEAGVLGGALENKAARTKKRRPHLSRNQGSSVVRRNRG